MQRVRVDNIGKARNVLSCIIICGRRQVEGLLISVVLSGADGLHVSYLLGLDIRSLHDDVG